MTVFIDTMVEAVRKYRAMLRKYLPQAERVNHLLRLNLKNPQLYTDEVKLFDLGHKVIEHLHELDATKRGYYSYSGISQFATHLKKFLDKYKIDKMTNRVVHTSQLASRHMVKITQLLALTKQADAISNDIMECNEIIALHGSKEQIELYQNTLHNMIRKNINNTNSPYRQALQHFNHCLQLEDSAESAA
jgi:hypothetical protein